MAYRHPYSRKAQPDETTRPPKPAWLQKPREHYCQNKNTVRGYDYWTDMYWATPPWLTDEHVRQLKIKREHATMTGRHVDHIVPIKNPIVCGLNVPWNLRVIPAKENLSKSNAHWPDMPLEPQDLFEDFRYRDFELSLQHAG